MTLQVTVEDLRRSNHCEDSVAHPSHVDDLLVELDVLELLLVFKVVDLISEIKITKLEWAIRDECLTKRLKNEAGYLLEQSNQQGLMG